MMIASVLLFIVITVFASINDKNLSFVIPFVFIAFPTNFNNIFPGVYLESEQQGVVYPIICHPELFLLSVLCLSRQKIENYKTPGLVYLLIASFLLSSILSIFRHIDNSQYILLLVAGQYPVRILILVVILVRNHSFYLKRFLLGICMSILFLTIESAVYSQVSDAKVLESGSLGVNTFGNVMGQMSCVLLFSLIILKFKYYKSLLYISILTGLTVTLLTETRMALLAIVVVFFVLLIPRMSKKIKFAIGLLIIGGAFFIVRSDALSDLSGKMDINTAISSIEISKSADIDIKQTESTSSLITRLELWTAATKMFVDYPLTGIGWNLFNVLKYKYGFEEKVIIDPHNGYFSFLCNLGIWAFFWIYFLFYRSWRIFYNSKNAEIKTLTVFNMGMTVCELTNAGSYKFGVLSMLLFISVYINYKYRIELQCKLAGAC